MNWIWNVNAWLNSSEIIKIKSHYNNKKIETNTWWSTKIEKFKSVLIGEWKSWWYDAILLVEDTKWIFVEAWIVYNEVIKWLDKDTSIKKVSKKDKIKNIVKQIKWSNSIKNISYDTWKLIISIVSFWKTKYVKKVIWI
jgi:hypothetical protein